MSLEYGWTPQEVLRVTLQQMEHYYARARNYRSKVPRLDALLVGVLGTFGVKQESGADRVERQIEKVSQGQITKEAREAWERAGLPSPAMPWLKRWMQDHGRRDAINQNQGPDQ